MIVITADRLHELFEYRDGVLYWKERPANRVDISKPAGTINVHGYVQINIKGKLRKAHRLIYKMFNEEWDIHDTSHDNQIDHIDEVKTNNRIENLRVADHSGNRHNEGLRKNNTSGHKGVFWDKTWKKWTVRVCKNSKIYCGGYFTDKEEAIAKAIEMREELHGEFANHG